MQQTVSTQNNTTWLPSRQQSQRFVVLGAGIAGLCAARELLKRGHRVTVVEKSAKVGGLARTFSADGFRFDIGGHRFHSNNPSVIHWLAELLPDDLLVVPRLSHIMMNDKFASYPIKFPQALSIFPPAEAVKILFSYLLVGITEAERKDISFEDWVVKRFGRRLFEAFFKPYTEKVWGIPCDQLSAAWANKRIGIPNMWRAVKDAIFPPASSPATSISQFYYPKEGFGMIPEALYREVLTAGGVVHTSSALLEFVPRQEGFQVTIARENGLDERLQADQVVSTVPLNPLLDSIPERFGSREISRACDLEYRKLICVFIALDKYQVSPDSWTYFPMRDCAFGRTHEPKNWSPLMVPSPDCTSLAAEIFTGADDPIWHRQDSEIADKVIDEMNTIGWVSKKEVIDRWVLRVPNAYPVYRVGYEHKLRKVKDYLGQWQGLHLVGRTGSFRYMNSDGVVEDVFRFMDTGLNEASSVNPLTIQQARWV